MSIVYVNPNDIEISKPVNGGRIHPNLGDGLIDAYWPLIIDDYRLWQAESIKNWMRREGILGEDEKVIEESIATIIAGHNLDTERQRKALYYFCKHLDDTDCWPEVEIDYTKIAPF